LRVFKHIFSIPSEWLHHMPTATEVAIIQQLQLLTIPLWADAEILVGGTCPELLKK